MSKRLTLKAVNKELKKYGYELVEGFECFKFVSIDPEMFLNFRNASVSIFRLNDVPTVHGWISELKYVMKREANAAKVVD